MATDEANAAGYRLVERYAYTPYGQHRVYAHGYLAADASVLPAAPRRRPYGPTGWVARQTERFGLRSTIRPENRPRRKDHPS